MLESENENDGRGLSLPWGLAGMLALVFVIETALARHWVDFTETSRSGWSLSARAAERNPLVREARVLAFGDSLVKHGVLPALIGDRTGLSAYNLSVPAAPAPVAYFIFKRALDAGAHPDAVVVDFKPDLLAGGIRFSDPFWPELLNARECVDLACVARDSQFVAKTLLARTFFSIRNRHEIRNRIVATIEGTADPLRATNLALQRNWRVNLGAQFTPQKPEFRGEISPEEHKKYLTKNWWCHRVNRIYIEKFLDLAESRGIRVYWLMAPIAPNLQLARDLSGTDLSHTRFVDALAARHRLLRIIDARRGGFEPSDFVDPVHLSGIGAIHLTAGIARALELGELSANANVMRRYEVMRGREIGVGPRFEDVDASKVATAGGGVGKTLR